jgi:ribosomal protein L37AE/L43A
MGLLDKMKQAAADAKAKTVCSTCGEKLSFAQMQSKVLQCPKCQLKEAGLTDDEAVAELARWKEDEATKSPSGFFGKIKQAAAESVKKMNQVAAEAAAKAEFRERATYVTGPWNIKGDTVGVVDRDGNNLTFTIGIGNKQTFTLPYQSIKKFTISTVDQLPRVTATRLLMVGVFALAWKKGQRDKFLQIDFVDNTNVETSIVFGKGSGSDINTLQSKIVAARLDSLKSSGGMPSLPAVQTVDADNIAARIEELAALRDKGILTPEEFQAKKSELLSRM